MWTEVSESLTYECLLPLPGSKMLARNWMFPRALCGAKKGVQFEICGANLQTLSLMFSSRLSSSKFPSKWSYGFCAVRWLHMEWLLKTWIINVMVFSCLSSSLKNVGATVLCFLCALVKTSRRQVHVE
jgi:hypothetical protein